MLKQITYLLFFLSVTLSSAQVNLSMSVNFTDNSSLKVFRANDSVSLFNELNKQIVRLESKGYIASKIVSNYWEENVFFVQIDKGELFEFNDITFNNTFNEFYNGISLSSEFNPNNIEGEFDKVLAYCENNGYPFATIQFSDVDIINTKVDAKVSLVLNDFFIIDSILIKGDVKTNRFVVYREIGIYPGDVYDESEINKINVRLTNSEFLSSIRYSEISFTKGKALLTVYVKDESNNKFGGILGINSDDNTDRIILSGDVDLKLKNGFRVGDKFILNWRKTRQNTQNFLVYSSFPYLFKSRFGINAELINLRRDTTFSNTVSKFGISYQVQNNQYISIFVKNNRSNSLFESNVTRIPDFNSTQVVYYGMEFGFNSFDYVLNPTKGFSLNGTISSGSKTITKTDVVTSEDYKNLQEQSTQYEIVVIGNKFFPLFRNSALLIKAQIGQLFNENIFDNELYQIGGLNSLRGFNEQSIVASNYFIGTFEYRFLFDKNSAFFTFLDYAYYEQRTNEFNYDNPYGFGIGVNLAVNTGVFTLSYALGTEQNNPILLRNSKVHFGFVSLF